MAKFSQLNISKHKGQVLDKIMSWKRQEVARLMDDMPLAQLKALASVAEPPLDFAAALTAEAGASLIAEVKRASPSKGLIAKDWSPTAIAETYAASGAAAISCLTDSRFFQGKLADLAEIGEHLRARNLVQTAAAQGVYLSSLPGVRGPRCRGGCAASDRWRAG